MSNLDNKLLGEKNHYYCSSSSDDEDDDRSDYREISVQSKIKWEGTSCNVSIIIHYNHPFQFFMSISIP